MDRVQQEQIKDVNDLDLPTIDTTFPRREQKGYALDVASKSWLAKNAVGFTALKHEDVSHILKDSRWHTALGLFAELNPNLTKEFKEKRKKGLLALNGENHSRLKRMVNPSFSVLNADKNRPFMNQLMHDLIEQKFNIGTVDLQKDIFNYYPIPTLCRIIGVPESDWKLFSEWSNFMFKIFNLNAEVSSDEVRNAQQNFDEYTSSLIAEKRKSPADDLISSLLQIEQNGDKLSLEELTMLIEITIASGIDTTRCQLGLTSRMILENENVFESISSDPKNNAQKFEELTRIDGVLRGTVRIASEDIVYKNILFPKNTLVFLNVVTANHDETIFENADTIFLNGRNNISKSLAFGAGMHYCLGSAIARAQMQEALTVLFTFLKGKLTSWSYEPLPKTSLINGLESLTVSIK